MNPLDFFDLDQLKVFFQRNKTEMSCMDKPQTFLNLLRDHHLIPENRYKKVIRMRNKENMKNGVYGVLDWLERERPQHVGLFWTCAFKDTMLNQYPTLRLLRNSLMDGSFQFNEELPERVETEESDEEKKGKGRPADEDEVKKKGRKGKSKKRSGEEDALSPQDDQPGPSSQSTPAKTKKLQKPAYSSPVQKGEKAAIWTWALFKRQLPVTCGDQRGNLSRSRMAEGRPCIWTDRRWYTPSQFEKLAGKQSCKNWKLSIHCREATLGKLLQEGHLTCPGFKKPNAKAKKILFPSSLSTASVSISSESEEDVHQDEDQQGRDCNHSDTEEGERGGSHDGGGHDSHDCDDGQAVFKVTCGSLTGMLHKARFASGTCGKSIRTERRWLSPVEFTEEGLSQQNASWRKVIKWEGKPLCVLIETKVLNLHSVLCKCRLCQDDPQNLEDQKNDDECFVCRSEGQGELVVCEGCPRSFHPTCHLPCVEEAQLGDGAPWMCTCCIWKLTKECQHPSQMTMEATLACPASVYMLHCHHLLLSLYNADEGQVFATDPGLYVTGYNALIRTPMWLDKVSEQLQNKRYNTVGQFVSDIQLIFANCAQFNQDNAEFRALGIRLKEFYDREFKNIFCIQQETDATVTTEECSVHGEEGHVTSP